MAEAAAPRPVPGDLLLHPGSIGALVLLVLNDHILKAAYPGVVTGKLSDVAGLILAPVVVVSIIEVVRSARGRPWGPSPTLAALAVAVVGLGFAAAKLFEPVAEAYRVGLGVLQWPFAAAVAVLRSVPVPGIQPVAFVADPTDLIALPALLLPLLLGRRRGDR